MQGTALPSFDVRERTKIEVVCCATNRDRAAAVAAASRIALALLLAGRRLDTLRSRSTRADGAAALTRA